MDSRELIDLFYNRAYEKFVNKQILDDKNYIVPRQQLKNYVNELVNIPYNDFINYIKQNQIEGEIKASDITQFSSFSACGVEMCNALIWANNPGCQYIDIGRFFPNNIIGRSDGAYRRYGENHIKAATQLGLTFEYYGYWYLSCLGYIYPDLDEDVRMHLLARTITRNRLYQRLLIDVLDHDVDPLSYISISSDATFKRRLYSVCRFFNLCLEECKKQSIRSYQITGRSINDRRRQNSLISDDNDYEQSIRFDSFLTAIARYPLCSIDEEIELIFRYQKGDKKACNKLIESNLRFVVSVAKTYRNQGLELQDLIQEGTIGLINAIEHFDYTRGIRFIKYAVWWIRQSIIQALVTQPYIVQIPYSTITIHRKVRDFIDTFEQKQGYPPSVDDIDINESSDIEWLNYIYQLPAELVKLTILKDDWDDYFSDHYADDALMMESQSVIINNILSLLSKRECDILKSVYGIGQEEKTLNDIADSWNYTRERVRQISVSAIRKLKESEIAKKIFYSDLPKSSIVYNEDTKEKKLVSITKEIAKSITVGDILFEQSHSVNTNQVDLPEDKIISTDTEVPGGSIINEDNNTTKENNDDNKLLKNTNTDNFSQDITNEEVKSSDIQNPLMESNHSKKDYYAFGLTIENSGRLCAIYDYGGRKIYSSTGRIVHIKKSLFRLSFTYTHYSVNLIEFKDESEFSTGKRIISADSNSQLYLILDANRYMYQIEDIGADIERKWYVKIRGKWFDKDGVSSSMEDADILYHHELSPTLSIFKYINDNNANEQHKEDSRIIKESLQSQSQGDNKLNHIKNKSEVMVGDRIIYNSKPCIVLDKRKKYNIVHLVVKYDDGIIDIVLGDKKKYEILNHRDNDYKQDLSIPPSQKIKMEEVDIPSRHEETISKSKSLEELYSYYTQLILKLNQAVVHGQKILAKPALLIVIIDAISNFEIQHNEFILNKWLEDKYNKILSRYINASTHLTGIEKPYWHLQSDNFWHLKYTSTYYLRRDFSPTKKWLIEHVEYAFLDDDLWYLLQDEVWRNKLRNFIIEHKLLEKSTSQNITVQKENTNKHPRSEKMNQPKFLITTSLNDLVRFGIITNKQLKHCYKKGLRTIGDVKKKIEYYHLTPDSTRFTKYTINMWFGIVGLLNNNI